MRNYFHRLLLPTTLLLVLPPQTAPRAHAATITVINADDSGPGSPGATRSISASRARSH